MPGDMPCHVGLSNVSMCNRIDAGLVYCMDYVRENLDWLHERLKPLIKGEATVHGPRVPMQLKISHIVQHDIQPVV